MPYAFKEIKNIVISVIIAIVFSGIGFTAYNVYSNLNKTIAKQTTDITVKDATIKDLTGRIALATSDLTVMKNKVDEANAKIAQNEIDLAERDKAYQALISTPIEKRYSNPDIISVIKNNDDNVTRVLKKISEMKYEDL